MIQPSGSAIFLTRKAWKICTDDFTVIQVLEFSSILMFWKENYFCLNHEISCWILAPFLSEAVEASLCHFFENWWMKLKFPYILRPLGTIYQQNHWSFYSSEPFTSGHFNIRHPVYTRTPFLIKWKLGSLPINVALVDFEVLVSSFVTLIWDECLTNLQYLRFKLARFETPHAHWNFARHNRNISDPIYNFPCQMIFPQYFLTNHHITFSVI